MTACHQSQENVSARCREADERGRIGCSTSRRDHETCHHKCDQGECFDQTGEFLRPAASAQAEPVQKCQNNYGSYGNQLDVWSQTRLKSGCEFAECDGQICNSRRLHHPIAAAHHKTGILAKGFTGIYVPSALLRKHRGKLSHGSGAEKHVNPAQDPNRDDEPWTSELSCDFTGRAQDARADCASNAHSKPKTDAHDA
jgi:hypothetical protein